MSKERVTKTGFGYVSTRDAYGLALREIGHEYPDVYVLTADCLGSVRAVLFGEEFPERTINFGIAEANMVGAAAGLALEGKIPFISGFSMLMSMRACEQIRTSIAYPNLNVKIVGTHSGLSMGGGGTTHHSTEDIAIIRSMANMTVIAPADGCETAKAARACVNMEGPVYMRLGRAFEATVCDFDYDFEIGKALCMLEGDDVTIIACGSVVHLALQAGEELHEKGISARVLNMHTVKPIDVPAIVRATEETAGIVTVEEHNVIGGLGSAVAEVVSEINPTRVLRIGVPDVYAGTGMTDLLREKLGITPGAIAKAAKRIVDG
jgi:transketolase